MSLVSSQFVTFTQLSALSSCISFQLVDICAKVLHCIILLITYLYNILINKSKLLNYIHAIFIYIAQFDNTVIIQCSVSMQTDVYSVLSYSITECSTGPASSDHKKHFVGIGPPWRSVVSVRVLASVVSPAAVRVCQQRLRKLQEQNTCHSKSRYIHGRHVMKIHAVN